MEESGGIGISGGWEANGRGAWGAGCERDIGMHSLFVEDWRCGATIAGVRVRRLWR